MGISNAEMTKRRESVTFMRHNSAIEGIQPDAQTVQIEEAYVRGDLTYEQFSDAMAAKAGIPPRDHAKDNELSDRFVRGEITVEEFSRLFASR